MVLLGLDPGCSTDSGSTCENCGVDGPDAPTASPDARAVESGPAPADAMSTASDAQPGDAGPSGPLSTCPVGASTAFSTPIARPTMPWQFVPENADAGTSGQVYVTYDGPATISITSTGPAVKLPGCGTLTWNTERWTNAVAAPAVADRDTVWASFYFNQQVICPYCGTRYDRSLTISTAKDGKILWTGSEGASADEMPATLQMQLFGVTATAKPWCQVSGGGGCYSATRQVFEHVLATDPPTLVQHATLTSLSVPSGNYQVLWAYSRETATRDPNCMDGGEIASDSGYAVSRILP